MGHQIIKQPDGKLAVFSSIVGDWIISGAACEEAGRTPFDIADEPARS